MAKNWSFSGPPETPGTIFDGSKGVQMAPPICETLFNPVQPLFNPKRAALPACGQILTNIAKNNLLGALETPGGHFRWVQRGSSGPSICEIQCSTLLKRCSTQIEQLGSPMAEYGQKMTFWGPLETPGTIFDGSKGVQVVPPYVRYNVQPS